LPESAEILAVHAALLHTGKVLYFSGSENNPDENVMGDVDHARLWDPVTRAVETVGSPTHDLFCAGHAFLGDGRLLAAGGTQDYGGPPNPNNPHSHVVLPRPAGLRNATVFDPTFAPGTNPWTAAPSMHPDRGRATGGGRWYPTLVTLPDGRVLTV